MADQKITSRTTGQDRTAGQQDKRLLQTLSKVNYINPSVKSYAFLPR